MSLAENLRLGMRRLASGVCVISAKVGDARFAMTASSVTSLSDNPASILVCINVDAAIQTHMKRGVPFAVSVLSSEQQAVSNICAKKDAAEERFTVGNWVDYGEHSVPYLEDSQVIFMCEVDNDEHIYGTHQIVIGRLVDVLLPDSAFDPLIYANGAYQKV